MRVLLPWQLEQQSEWVSQHMSNLGSCSGENKDNRSSEISPFGQSFSGRH